MIKFSKMQGIGNDFILIDGHDYSDDYVELSKKICDRHFGIGADGLMVSEESSSSDIKMIYINSDGSIGEMCGNGIRCFSKFVYENRLVLKDEFTVETLAGEKKVKLNIVDGEVKRVKVLMDKLVENDINSFYNRLINIEGKEFEISYTILGVPHAIIYIDKLNKEALLKYGPLIEKHEIFPKNTNVNFVEIIDKNNIKIDTWERGAGNTLACGTGATASVLISNRLGKVLDEVNVKLPGGELNIILDKKEKLIYMEGPAVKIAVGNFYLI